MVVLYVLAVAGEQSRSFGNDDAPTKFTFSLVTCDDVMANEASLAPRVHMATLRDTPVRVRLAMMMMMPVPDDVTSQRQWKSWSADIVVHKNAPKNVTLPARTGCSSPANSSGVQTNGA